MRHECTFILWLSRHECTFILWLLRHECTMYIHTLVNTMPFLYLCCNTGCYIYIIYFVWLKVTTTSVHVSLSIEQASCIRWYINRHWFSSRHGPKCHSLSSFSYCKEYLYVRNIFYSQPTLPLEVVVVVTFNKIGAHLSVFAFGLISLAVTSPSFVFSCYVMLRSLSAFILVRSSKCQWSRLVVLGR